MEESESPDQTSFCRLCGDLNNNGTYIFSEEGDGSNLCTLINKYLPLKVENDGKYPDKICPGCEIQLQATKLFFDSIIVGQNRLNLIYNKIQMQAGSILNISSKVGAFEIYSASGEKYFIQIIDNASLEGPLITADHEIMKSMPNLTTVKRKRGRPKKQFVEKGNMENLTDLEKNEEKEPENNSPISDNMVSADGKRRRKIPARFIETVQGKELDDMLRKEGIDEEDLGSVCELRLNEEEVIDRKESESGEKQTKPAIINCKGTKVKEDGFPRRRKRKYKCDECSKLFRNYQRLRLHKEAFHKNNQTDDSNIDTNLVTETQHLDKGTIHTSDENAENSEALTVNSPNPTTNENNLINNENTLDPLSNGQICEEKNGKIEESLTCKQCNKVFSCRQNLRLHLHGVHEKKRPFTCPDCKQTFSYAKSFKMHQLKHKRGVFTCEVCQKKFNYTSSLDYHRNAEHNNGKRFPCNKCDKTFKHPQLLHRHKLVHSEERPFKCDLCTSSFKTSSNLRSHMAVHTGERSHICTECGQGFTHKTSLKYHMRWHLGEKPFTCEICKKSFSQKGNLLEHQRIHTGEKPFCCEQCGRKFTTSSQLNMHKKRHTRSWKCAFCLKKFLHKNTWKDHNMRHMNTDRPYNCHICSKAFTALCYLKKHMRLHSGDKPYSCGICGIDFSDSSNLIKHRRTHQQKSPNQNQVPLLPNTGTDNNLFYVYLDTPKGQNVSPLIVKLEQPQHEVVVSSEQNLASFKDDSMQFQQVVDQEGNPLSLNTQDGQQINVVTSITNGQEKLQGLLPDGTLVAIDLQDSKVESMERLVDHLEEETNVSHLVLDGSMTFLNDGIIKSESEILVTEEPNLCFVTYDPNTGNIIE